MVTRAPYDIIFYVIVYAVQKVTWSGPRPRRLARNRFTSVPITACNVKATLLDREPHNHAYGYAIIQVDAQNTSATNTVLI